MRKKMAERISKAEWKKRRKRKRMIRRYSILGGLALIIILILIMLIKFVSFLFSGNEGVIKKAGDHKITEKLLSEAKTSRSGQELKEVKGIVIHATNQPGVSAEAMWKTYEEYGKSGNNSESMHFIVDTNGSILQCIPCSEIAFHAMGKNADCLGVQFCHSSSDGSMTDDVYKAMVDLVTKLCKEYKLTTDQVYLHYDVSGRMCPAYYVENSEAWQNFLKAVSDKLK